MRKLHIQTVEVGTDGERLKVFSQIVDEDGAETRAELPQRELSTLLPRNVLLGESKIVSAEMLLVIEATLTRLLTGRCVRVWEYDDRRYFGFLSWRSVTIGEASL